jgi:non-ribosomal peptide synthetase component F
MRGATGRCAVEDRALSPPAPARLHAFFERQADLRPDAIAVEGPGRRLSYARLDAEANRLARHLRSLGVGAGDCVAMLLPRSPDVYVALLAILKAGAAYVPLDPDYPADRVSYILSDAGARALVTTSALEARRGDYRGEVVLLDGHRDAIASASARRIEPGEDPREDDALCYVIYTSGTTGRPKGVQVEHRAACHLVGAERGLFGVGPDDRVFQGFSIAFDASVEEVWLAFASGATLVVGTREMIQAGPDLARRLTEGGVTVLSCVPTLLSMLEDDLPTVRLLILGGEACPPHLVARW